MSPPRKSHRIVVACLTAGLLASGAAPAGAAENQEAILQDDPEIVFPKRPGALDRTLARVKALGVDRIRASVFWEHVAPNPRSRLRPDFGPLGARSPASYPAENWDRYDAIVKLAAKHRLGVLFTITGPGPAWAGKGKTVEQRNHTYPRPRDYADFVEAVGTRYSGSYPDDAPGQAAAPPAGSPGGPPSPPGAPPPPDAPSRPDAPSPPSSPAPSARAAADGPPLPRVDHWSIWNEPNFPSWLSPQRVRVRGGVLPYSPTLYRRLVDAAWGALERSGHRYDVILLGETAPRGDYPNDRKLGKTMIPLSFIRELYCLNRKMGFFRPKPARRRGCPTTARSRQAFAATHPGLFQASGWAHHPYSFENPPNWDHKVPDAIPLGGIRRMSRTLDRALLRWGVTNQMQIWMTEYGYQTKPPEPYKGVSWNRQASWNSWAEEIAYRNPRVASFAQFLLVDDRPHVKYKGKKRWVTWQSGLLTWGGRRKPSYEEFQRPISVLRAGRGAVTVFGTYRPADSGVATPARIEFRRGGGEWETLRSLTVVGERGYLRERVALPGPGDVRIVWTDPSNAAEIDSRIVAVGRR